ncbi:PAS domain-containing protein [Pedobacter frigidisoli]|uniref:PAS domain-containing protein n=1 Tax=Pedobacter frigidisoli TaxID=2530455 RepID=UPI0029303A11|nr:PAS domain-containing protein [Pedobacter frigidisoli]
MPEIPFLDAAKIIEVFAQTKTATAIHVGEDAHIQFANDTMLNIWGKDKSVLGKSLADALPELVGQPFIEMFRKVWLEGLTISGSDTPAELNIDGKNQIFYFDFEYRAILDDNGKTICILHSAVDITERYLKQHAIEEARQNAAYLAREQAHSEELAGKNIDLAAALEELRLANQELETTKISLQQLNERLDSKVRERTETIAFLNQELEASNEEIRASNEELAASNEEMYKFTQEITGVYEKLKISQDDIELAISAAGLGTFDLDPVTGKFAGNDTLKSWFGLQPEDLIELEKATDVISPTDRERVTNAIAQALDFNSGGNYEVLYAISNPENPIPKIVKAKGKTLFDKNKQAIRLSGVLQDVTEQVTSEERMQLLISNLEASEQRFRRLIEQAPVAITVFKGPELIIESANERMLEIWGKTSAVEGKRFDEVLPEIADQPFINILQKVLESGEPYHGVESKAIILKDNVPQERYFNFVYQPIEEENGNIERVLQVVTEVTEQVNSRQEILEVNNRLKIAMDAGSLGSTEVDLATGTMVCNDEFKRAFGRNVDQDFVYAEMFEAMLPQYRDRIR